MIRVLVAEDSATARALLVGLLESDPEIRVVGQACDGVEAVELTRRLAPDLVTMDLEMPRMGGLEATREIMSTAPTPIVIVTGTTRAEEVGSSMGVLRTGALDVVVKPPGPGVSGHEAAVRELIAIVKAMSRVKVVRQRIARAGPLPPAIPYSVAPPGPIRIVAVATSTGGPPALQRLLSGLPADFRPPLLVVQHITPGFTAGFVAWLGSTCALRVKEAEHGEALAPRTAYVAPDHRHLGTSARGTLVLSDAAPVGGFRPSATHLFESVARAFGPSAAAVILTGMGEDGVAGLRLVRQSGGRVIAQDEATSIVFGMPGAAVAAGLADAVLPIEAIAARLSVMANA